MIDWREDPDRWVERRMEYLSSTGVGLRDTVAEAVAWSELGYSSSGIAKKMDVGDSTASKYLERASDVYDGILLRTAAGLDGPETSVEDLPAASLQDECPVCYSEMLVSPEEAERVFNTSGWGATAMLEDADVVCSYCHSARINGVWKRVQTADSRAYELSNAGNKSRTEYRDRITQGITTGESRSDRAASNPEEMDW